MRALSRAIHSAIRSIYVQLLAGSTPLPREVIEKLYGGLFTVVKRRDDVTKSRIRDVTAGVHGIHSSLIKNHHNRRSELISGAPPSFFIVER